MRFPLLKQDQTFSRTFHEKQLITVSAVYVDMNSPAVAGGLGDRVTSRNNSSCAVTIDRCITLVTFTSLSLSVGNFIGALVLSR